MLRSFWRLSQDPNRLGEVFAIADRGSKPEILAETARFVARDPQGARTLGEGLRLGPVDLVALKKLPEGTLGRVFADHMIENGLDPRAIPVPTYPPGDFRYVKTHLREIHDIWHVVTGFDTDVAGEIGLQAFYLAQLPSRLSAVLIAMAFVHMATKNIEARDPIMNAVLRGWASASRRGRSSGSSGRSTGGRRSRRCERSSTSTSPSTKRRSPSSSRTCTAPAA